MDFRSKLLDTLRAVSPILEQPGVMVVGSEVPNLLESEAASTLVVSQDVDIAVPIACREGVKECLRHVDGLAPSPDEPSVWLPRREGLLEVNFLGIDPALRDLLQSYVLEDEQLPLLVFGGISQMRVGRTVVVEGVRIPLPRVADLLLEKLVTERSGTKGDRDLLVVLGLLVVSSEQDLSDLEDLVTELPDELFYAVRTNLAVLSLLEPVPGMPDPTRHRATIARLLHRLEAAKEPT